MCGTEGAEQMVVAALLNGSLQAASGHSPGRSSEVTPVLLAALSSLRSEAAVQNPFILFSLQERSSFFLFTNFV